jgi:hypothetical protein
MFESVQLKIERADHHIADLERQFEAFVARKPHRFAISQDPKSGQPTIQIRFVETVPKLFSAIIGDAVHNLRSALDHMTWDIIGYDGGTQDRDLQFPCRGTREQHKLACEQLKTPSDWVRQFLVRHEAFPEGIGQIFHLLNRLDNADKHRAIDPIMAATSHPPFQTFNADGSKAIHMSGNMYSRFGEGNRIEIAQVPPGGWVQLEDDASCPPSIFFKEFTEGDVFQTLEAGRQSTFNVLVNAVHTIGKNPKI